MKQEYFIRNGIRYDKGTIVILLWFNPYARNVYNEKAKFLYYDTDKDEYTFEIWGQTFTYPQEIFEHKFVEIYDPNKVKAPKAQPQPKQHTFSDELKIDGLAVAWVWYVFIMAVAVIFYDRIGIWILASIIFFNYRSKKLKEAGYK